MPSGCQSTSVTFILTNQFNMQTFALLQGMEQLFGHNSSKSGKIFTLQEKIITIMAGAQPRNSCRSLFKQLEIPPVLCQCTLSLMNCIINNQEIFQTNSSIHNIYTRNSITVAVQMPNYLVFKKVPSILA